MANKTLKVSVSLDKPSDLLGCCYPNGKAGGMTVHGAVPGAVGQRCELQVKITNPVARHFTVRGYVAWARTKGQGAPNDLYGVDFLPEDEAGRARLFSYARNEVPPGQSRFEERIYVSLPVRITHEGKTRGEFVIDVSQGGAFVRCVKPPPVHSVVGLTMRPPRSITSLKLKARVCWHRTTGADQGMGMEFLFDDASQAETIRKLVIRLSRQ